MPGTCRKVFAILGAAVVSLGLLWLTAVAADRVTVWLFAHPGGAQSRTAIFAAACFFFAAMAVARRRQRQPVARLR